MRLSSTMAYALGALVQLAQSDPAQPVSCRQLAEAGQMPKRFLLQILRNLVCHGILKSTRGVEGGYALARGADEISLLEVVESVYGPLVFELPGLAADARPQPTLDRLAEGIRRELGKVKLSELVARPAPGAPRDPSGPAGLPHDEPQETPQLTGCC